MDASYLQSFLSDSARRAKRSEIRELLKLASQPDVISLAGGMPSPDVFPIEELAAFLPEALRTHGRSALQYGPTEGDPGMIKELIRLGADEGLPDLTPDRILVVSASQQGLDLCSRVFIGPGDTVLCDLPSYVGALGAFSACGARLSGIPLDEDGTRVDLLEQRLLELRRQGIHPKLFYAIPDFQNPAGVTMSRSRREDLLGLAADFDLLVIEDSPYRALRYVGETLPSLASLDRDGRVISLFTFSKVLFPGLRLGWIAAAPEIIATLVTAKQPVDLCTSPFTQMVTREFLRRGLLPDLLARIRGCYAAKRQTVLEALDRHVDPSWGVHWTRPEGGMFLWLTLPPWMNCHRLLERSLARKVAFVSGSAFHCDGGGNHALRLNFSYPSSAQIETGVERLVAAMAEIAAEDRTERPPPVTHVEMPPTPATIAGEYVLDQLALTLALTEVQL